MTAKLQQDSDIIASDDQAESTENKWTSHIDIAWKTFKKLSPGGKAELRRGTASEPFWRILTRIGKEKSKLESIEKWQLMIQLIAIASYKSKKFGIAGHDSTKFGSALRRAGYSEARLNRLLEADSEQLPGILKRTARQLSGANQSANWNTVRRLIFDYKGEASRVRLQIAQEYFTAKSTTSTTEDTNHNE